MAPTNYLNARGKQATGMSAQAQIAIAVGVIVPVVLLTTIAFGFWLWRRQRSQSKIVCEEDVKEVVEEDFRVINVRRFVINEEEPRTGSPALSSGGRFEEFSQQDPTDTRPFKASEQREASRWPSSPVPPYSVLPELAGEPVIPQSNIHTLIASSPQSNSKGAASQSNKEKKEFDLEHYLGIDKRSLLQEWTKPQGESRIYPCHGQESDSGTAKQPLRLRVAPASVGNSWDPSVSVSPWDVEYQPNPVLFSHFNNSPVGSQDDVSPVSVTSLSWPTAPAEVQSLGLFEMDAVENEFNPWLHGPIPTVQGVPHRWEKTPGTDRMFFEAEHDLFPRRKKRRTSDQAARDAQRQRCEHVGTRVELPAFDSPTELYAPAAECYSLDDLPMWDTVQISGDSGDCSTISSAFPSYDSIFSEGFELMDGGDTVADAICTPITPSSANPLMPEPNALSGW
jgi:hypothetical protein